MSKLVEICNSNYNHTPLTQFGKKYYKSRYSDKIVCEECMDAWISDISTKLAREIYQYLRGYDMPSLCEDKKGDYRTESVSFEMTIDAQEYMKYLVDCKMSLDLYLDWEFEKRDVDTSGCVADIAITNCKCNKMTAVRRARANIKSIRCESSNVNVPKIRLSLVIEHCDTEFEIGIRIGRYLRHYYFNAFDELSDMEVQVLMNNSDKPTYDSGSSDCTTSAVGSKCFKCSTYCGENYYLYQNTMYCLNCMYGIVVELAADANITDFVGLSTDKVSNTYMIRDTPEWKRAVIDKYIFTMNSFGVNPGIIHVYTTVQG